MNHAKSFLKASVSCFVLLTFLSGCAKDYSIAPPAEGEKVRLIIKMPEELEAKPCVSCIEQRYVKVFPMIAMASRRC
jgi:hypothetical protein